MKSQFGTKKRRLGAMEYAKATVFVLGPTVVSTAESGLKACALVREPTQTHKAMSMKANGRMIRCMGVAKWICKMAE